MAREGRNFELAYKDLFNYLDKENYKIKSPAFLYDKAAKIKVIKSR